MVGSARATTVESSIRMKRPRQVPTSTHHWRLDSEITWWRAYSRGRSSDPRRGQLEDGRAGGAANDVARRNRPAEFDHASPLVQEDQVELKPHAEGVDASAPRNHQSL